MKLKVKWTTFSFQTIQEKHWLMPDLTEKNQEISKWRAKVWKKKLKRLGFYVSLSAKKNGLIIFFKSLLFLIAYLRKQGEL